MGKIKEIWINLSLRKSIVLHISFFAILAVILSTATAALCSNAQQKIESARPPAGEKYYLTNEKGERLGDGTYISKDLAPTDKKDEILISTLEFLPRAATPVYSALCVMAAALLFYRNKLKQPLAQLKSASEKISDNNLDFQMEYHSKDELGQLCASFELMRVTLAGNLSEMWRQMEERKQLNAAFAHDLRTPLTVLKGYCEILLGSEHPQTREIAAVMEKHVTRMEAYVDGMSRLQRMEDAKPECKSVPVQSLVASLHESAQMLCTQNHKKLFFQNHVKVSHLSLDSTFILQVHNNLISNAARYAKSSVTLSVSMQDGCFLLSVSDDGKGFSQSILHQAANPYVTEEHNDPAHFGLGLYICRLLCERHNGRITIVNLPVGDRVTASFQPSEL